MSTHTPGPWRVTGPGYIGSTTNGYIPIITPYTDRANRDKHGGATPEAMANAHLIATAPELLEALEAAIALFNEPTRNPSGYPIGEPSWCPGARAAIAKARGE